MSHDRLTRRALAALVAAGVIGTASASQAAAPFACEIHVSEKPGAVALEAIVSAFEGIEGSYELNVSGSGEQGGSDVSQSGEFSLGAGERKAVGTVMLGTNGGDYVARLAVTSGSAMQRCTKRVVGTL